MESVRALSSFLLACFRRDAYSRYIGDGWPLGDHAGPQRGGPRVCHGFARTSRTWRFRGEFLVLFGAYRANVSLTIVATLGLLAATLYGLRFVQGAFHGPNLHHWKLPDMRLREWTVLGPMILCL